MPKKTVGYVELEWTCKRCGIKNPGTQKTCTGCGAPMGADERFALPEQQKPLEDQEKIAQAQKGADIHCPYCGTRNPAGSATCSQCAGDLREGKARQAGQVLGAHADGAVPEKPCPYCTQPNPVEAQRCSKCGGVLKLAAAAPVQAPAAARPLPKRTIACLGVALAVLCLGALAFILFGMRTDQVTGTVSGVAWERAIQVLAMQPVEYETWYNEVPSGAEVLDCRQELRDVSSQPVAGAEEVCGTPYVVDTGGGVGEVVQDCEYNVYDDYCRYTVTEWAVVDTITVSGSDLFPSWPNVALDVGQQEGERSESFLVYLDAGGETYSYTPSNFSEFSQFEIGSDWLLTINGFGTLVAVAPR